MKRWRSLLSLSLLLALQTDAFPSLSGETDADAGELRDDILEINLQTQRNLFEGDIARDPRRNALLNETTRWQFPIPYILTDSLDLNAKGVILQALETYRLKSCVDFKPYEGESTYISFTKLDGCWSFVGDLKTGQNVSIGERCDTKAIVEHELLHALGFYHEQSRSDRDDYVKIWWDQIIPGKEHNFNKYEDDFITDLNTAYDYESIMHYRPLSFNKDPEVPTITTTIPAFNGIIGQRLDFSALDLERLNRMYDCAESHTLLDQCAFEQINICGMIQNDEDDADWIHTVSSADEKDHTLGGQCKDAGYYMKFDTVNKTEGHSALLESRILYPKRSRQCLEFFYRMSGGAGDQLVLWVRMDDGTGSVRKVRKVHTLQGDGDESWRIAQVRLSVEEKFRYIFQGIVGSRKPSGAIMIDDITLTETECPNTVWRIPDFQTLLNKTAHGVGIPSGRFYSSEGYAYGLKVYPNGRTNSSREQVGVTFHLFSGENDAVLEWPAIHRQVTVTLVDQNPDATLRMSSSRSFTTDADVRWNKPSTAEEWDDACGCFRGPEFGWSNFISHEQLHRREFLKNHGLVITVQFDDLTHLLKSEVHPPKSKLRSFPQPAEESLQKTKVREPRAISDPCHHKLCHNGGACVSKDGKASCRCSTGHYMSFAGESCEKRHVAGGILGILMGAAAGSVALTVAVVSVICRRRKI